MRIVHLGLGAFFRAHGAWYTAHATDAHEWGIAGFTGSSDELPAQLTKQDGLYTLTTRGLDGDLIEVVPNIVQAHPGSDAAAWRASVADPSVEVITLTVTEAAYTPGPASVAARLVEGLDARRAAGSGPVTIVPCDNVADNGVVLRRLVLDEVDRRGDGALVDWIEESVGVVSTVVDRITPRPTDADVAAAATAGWADAAPVVTEPFSEWILSGDFASRHPDWASAGARFADDLGPFARRKLHLLNGSHSLLAYAGLNAGHTTVAEAISDDRLREMVETWWDEAAATVGGTAEERDAYRSALRERFANSRMHHRLAQIAIDGSTKLPQRIVPVAKAELAAGRDAGASAQVIGAWIAYVRRVGTDLVDARRNEVATTELSGRAADDPRRLIGLLDIELADHDDFVAQVADRADAWSATRRPGD